MQVKNEISSIIYSFLQCNVFVNEPEYFLYILYFCFAYSRVNKREVMYIVFFNAAYNFFTKHSSIHLFFCPVNKLFYTLKQIHY